MRLGIAHHFGWAVAVTATSDHRVVDRRRVELIESGLSEAPIHQEGGAYELRRAGPPLDDHALADLVARVRASVVRAAAAALDEVASRRGWDVHLFDAKDVESRAAGKLGARAEDVLFGPRATIGPPWTKDHRMALSATIIAGPSGDRVPK